MTRSVEKLGAATPEPADRLLMPHMVYDPLNPSAISLDHVRDTYGSDGLAMRTELALYYTGLGDNQQIRKAQSLANAFHATDKRADGGGGQQGRHMDHVNYMFLQAVEEFENRNPDVLATIFMHDAGMEDHPSLTALSQPNISQVDAYELLTMPGKKEQTRSQTQRTRDMAHTALKELFPDPKPKSRTPLGKFVSRLVSKKTSRTADIIKEVTNPIVMPGESKQGSYDEHMKEMDGASPEARFVKGLDNYNNGVLNHNTKNPRIQLNGDVKYAKHFARNVLWIFRKDSLTPVHTRQSYKERFEQGEVRAADRVAQADPELLREVNEKLTAIAVQ